MTVVTCDDRPVVVQRAGPAVVNRQHRRKVHPGHHSPHRPRSAIKCSFGHFRVAAAMTGRHRVTMDLVVAPRECQQLRDSRGAEPERKPRALRPNEVERLSTMHATRAELVVWLCSSSRSAQASRMSDSLDPRQKLQSNLAPAWQRLPIFQMGSTNICCGCQRGV